MAAVFGATAVAAAPSLASGFYTTLVGTGNVVPTGARDIGLHGDDLVKTINLPFPVKFYGVNYNQVTVSTNGNLQFGGSANTAFSNDCLPSATIVAPAIMGYWDDLTTFNSGGTALGIFKRKKGTSPTRTFVLEWRALRLGTSDSVNFSVVFRERQTRISVVYGNNDDATLRSTTAGVQDGFGSATQIECNGSGPVAPLAPGTRVDYIFHP